VGFNTTSQALVGSENMPLPQAWRCSIIANLQPMFCGQGQWLLFRKIYLVFAVEIFTWYGVFRFTTANIFFNNL
jgi:hypothetical protein